MIKNFLHFWPSLLGRNFSLTPLWWWVTNWSERRKSFFEKQVFFKWLSIIIIAYDTTKWMKRYIRSHFVIGRIEEGVVKGGESTQYYWGFLIKYYWTNTESNAAVTERSVLWKQLLDTDRSVTKLASSQKICLQYTVMCSTSIIRMTGEIVLEHELLCHWDVTDDCLENFIFLFFCFIFTYNWLSNQLMHFKSEFGRIAYLIERFRINNHN